MTIQSIKLLYANKDKMHNWNHILRIRKNTNLIKKDYKNLNEDLLNFLINFHGLKDYVTSHAVDFPKDFITSLLRSHKNPKKVEEKIVFDANMLDNVGKQGLKKALYVGKTLGRSKEDTYKYLRENLKKATFYTKTGKDLGQKELGLMKERVNS